ncbi:MAG: hypothetical protein M1835_000673 [Candelina submexicana]|nr:MAG: hypothetical protein M1835_000673 [Candelina submexicana]
MGLDYMHRRHIRHKDIKPGNILMKGGRFIFTDFGLAFDFIELEQSTTSGRPSAMTRKYCPIEVIEWGHRGRSADVLSLGCVFVQILTVLAGKNLDELEDSLIDNEDASQNAIFCFHLHKVRDWLSSLVNDKFKHASEWCVAMIYYERTDRVGTHELLEKILHDTYQDHYPLARPFCKDCEEILGREHQSSDSLSVSRPPSNRVMERMRLDEGFVAIERFPQTAIDDQQTPSTRSRPGMSIRDRLNEGSGQCAGRSETDTFMLNALNRGLI